MKVSKGQQSQPEIVAAAFFILYMVLGRPFLYRVLIVTQVLFFVEFPLKGVHVGTLNHTPTFRFLRQSVGQVNKRIEKGYPEDRHCALNRIPSNSKLLREPGTFC